MKGSSKVIVGATLITVLCLALVLGLVFVLLAELYCSLFLRRRQQQLRHRTTSSSNMTTTSPPASTTITTNEAADVYNRQQHSVSTPSLSLSSFYAHGVLRAPRNFLFPSVHANYEHDLEKQQLHSMRSFFAESQTHHHHQLPSCSSSSISSTSQEFFNGHTFSLPTSPTTFVPLASPRLVQEVPLDEICGGNYADDHNINNNNNNSYMYICNPIYDNDGNMPRRVDTPFETPDSSPSRLETIGSSGEEDDDDVSRLTTPPLTPMKKLPTEGCSVSLRDARSIPTSGTDSNNSNIYEISSSSSSGSPCTSPSW